MREFTVADIAELLDVNEETVRRWRIRGRNGVQLMVPSAGERPGRKGYRITEEALRRFLDKNPSLMTPAMRGELDGTAGGSFAPSAVAPAAAGADVSFRGGRTSAVMQSLIQEKLERRAELLAQLDRIDEEIGVLRALSEASS